jgi:hypothetical protein
VIFGEKLRNLGETWVKVDECWVVLEWFFNRGLRGFSRIFRANILTGLQDKRKI